MARRHAPAPPPPPVAPRPVGEHQPHWTVAFPTYNVDEALFEKALRSVLDQDPGPDRMQILIVDDCSPGSSLAESIGQRLSPGRIEFFRNERNLGLAGNWNRCIALARGYWVHLLHQDDLVLPGFYEAAERADAAGCGVAFCQHAFIDAAGAWLAISPLERGEAGPLDGWLGRLMERQPVQCAAVAVRRDCYENLGGYRADLRYVVDWEMWVRLAAHEVAWWYTPRVLACYRNHSATETARLRQAGEDIHDIGHGIEVVGSYLPEPYRAGAGRGLRRLAATWLLREAGHAFDRREARRGLAAVHRARRMDPSLVGAGVLLNYYKWAIKSALRSGPLGTAT